MKKERESETGLLCYRGGEIGRAERERDRYRIVLLKKYTGMGKKNHKVSQPGNFLF